MTRPRGVVPACIGALDDSVLELQCSNDAQTLNTAEMLERFALIFADGEVDDRDTEHVLYLHRHTRLEDRLNRDDAATLTETRMFVNGVLTLLAGYRQRLQGMKKAALASGLQNVRAAR